MSYVTRMMKFVASMKINTYRYSQMAIVCLCVIQLKYTAAMATPVDLRRHLFCRLTYSVVLVTLVD